MCEWLKDFQHEHPFKLILYTPIDGVPFPRVHVPLLLRADATVTCSRFGQKAALAACPDADVTMIYHGVDVDTFRPLGPKEEFQASQSLGGKFVVGCVARNQPRKLFPVLVKAFARFAARHPEALLYLHSDPNDVGWDLVELARSHGLGGRTAFSFQANPTNGIDGAGLNQIYNMMNVMVLPTSGEGFGLPILEAMAAGVPVVATRYSACEELIDGRGELIDVKAFFPAGRNCIEHALPDIDDLEAKLELLAAEPDRRARHTAAGHAFAQQLSWDALQPRWEELLTRFQ
jgi:glycosyltransferase involved in cell wall biosynthesis